MPLVLGFRVRLQPATLKPHTLNSLASEGVDLRLRESPRNVRDFSRAAFPPRLRVGWMGFGFRLQGLGLGAWALNPSAVAKSF